MPAVVDLTNEFVYGGSIFPAGERTATVNGASVDLQDCGPEVTVDAIYGQVTPGTTCTITLQESADDSTWTNITGASMTAVSTASPTNQTSERLTFFNLAQRYVRAVATLSGASDGIFLAVGITGRRKSY